MTTGSGTPGPTPLPDVGQSSNVGPIGSEFALEGNEQDMAPAIQSATDPDKLFLVCAAVDNQCEIRLAELAQQKSQDTQVKQIAQRVTQDHQQAQDQLKSIAQASGVELPHGTPGLQRQEMKILQGLNGKDFDQQYIAHVRAAHAKAVQEYQDVAQLAKNQQIKDYASKTLPTLQQHDQDIQQAATALGLPSGNEAQTVGARMNGDAGSSSGSK